MTKECTNFSPELTTDMRRELKNQEGLRKSFEATFVKFGKKINYLGYTEETVLLKNIVDTDQKNSRRSSLVYVDEKFSDDSPGGGYTYSI